MNYLAHMQSWLRYYFDSYKGFRREVWVLTLVSLINRAGTMVIPFLSLYLTGEVGMSLQEVGWVMSAFGLGSLVGSWSGGRLSDKIGPYPTMLWSMITPGLLFILLQFVTSFYGFCLAIFLVMAVADTFRPAMFVALRSYSKPENRTRSVTLVRLAVNLGFSIGPAIGGFVIAKMGYLSLFWVDGFTCLLAGLVILFFLPKKDSVEEKDTDNDNGETLILKSPWKDKTYLTFLFAVFLVGFVFLQLFSSVPLYYRDYHHLGEQPIGILLGINGLIIFFLEMPLIKFTEDRKMALTRLLIISAILIGFSYIILNLWFSVWALTIGMLLITVGEMLNFPIANRVAMDRAEGGKIGDYMGLYTIAFSIAHIVGHNGGLFMIHHFGYEVTWWIMGACALPAIFIYQHVGRRLSS